ncbi:hypothetical protein EAI_09661 [Harpegnathos saltator]|uniref:Uncharacterized protein n=1 Tax=Harpegnathos saltator TaxID=610380 RepID=E2C9Y3_HARSA|nr:hypothetical protein EAI_09661 [Harpegnathos saltator]
MNRNVLDGMSMKQLQEEAVKFCLSVSNDRKRMIDLLMSHLERNGPMKDLLGLEENSVSREEQQTAETSAEEQPEEEQALGALQNMMGAVTDSLAKIQQLMQMQ